MVKDNSIPKKEEGTNHRTKTKSDILEKGRRPSIKDTDRMIRELGRKGKRNSLDAYR